MRTSRMVFWGLSLASVILSGSVSAVSTSARNVAGEEASQIHFSGKVVDADGIPIEGARVRFYELINAGTVYSRGTKPPENVTTGTDGAFTFAAPAKSDGYRYAYIVAEKERVTIPVPGSVR